MTLESYTDKTTLNRAAENAARFFSFDDENARLAAGAGRSARRAAALRLVKAAKSPTDRFPGLTGAYFNRLPARRQPAPVELDQPAPGFAPDLRQPGTWAVVERRPWAGEWRLRMETRPGAGVETPDQAGDRITAMLTERGARKISESCYFMACARGGFSTFLTLTLTPEARAKLRRRVLRPMLDRDADGFPVVPAEPARAKQGPLGVIYSTGDETPAYNVAEINGGRQAVVHPDSGAPYTPLRWSWAWSVQREASRFFEAAGKMYQRGWQHKRPVKAGQVTRDKTTGAEYTPIRWETVKVPGSRALYCVEGEQVDGRTGARFTRLKWWREPLHYLWVAENPHLEDDEGNPVADEWGELQTNPHLHVLIKWRVPYRSFRAWAARIERLWGHGMAHLEKIKDPQKAGSYVAKAAGYLTKAQGKSDQGEIRGNRYGISKRARAPGWIECERYQVGMMGWLLAEAHEAWNEKHGEKIQKRDRLKRELDAAKDGARRQKIGALLEQVRGEIEPLPRVSKYAALFKSEEQKTRFFDWAARRGWTPEPQHSLWLAEWRRQQWRRRNRARLAPSGADWAYWFALADAGAVACNDEEQEERLAV